MSKIINVRHPDWVAHYRDYEKQRLTFEGGSSFLDKYLVSYSTRESITDFTKRKSISYCAAHAKSALLDIKNSLYQRMVDIQRQGGSDTYQKCSQGLLGGVDRKHSSMTTFIGSQVLEELLIQGKVGVFVDRKPMPSNLTKDKINDHPYLYIYRAEDILSWNEVDGKLIAVLLQQSTPHINPETGLIQHNKKEYLHMIQTEAGTVAHLYSSSGDLINSTLLDLSEIPFIIASIGESVLKDVADYQISMTNLASSDMSYAYLSNFPFLTEQFEPMSDLSMLKLETASQKEPTKVSTLQGRRYPKGLERPEFISPSTDPLLASMQKQEQLRKEIRYLVNLAVETYSSSSADSKAQDRTPLEAGLSYIGMILERLEKNIANIWAEYEGSNTLVPEIIYPKRYQLMSEKDCIEEAKMLREVLSSIPSKTFQLSLAEHIAEMTISNKVDFPTMEKIRKEIRSAEVVITDPDIIKNDHEAGFVSTEFASSLRGYPKGQVEQAKKDHAERLARIAAAQAPDVGAARGIIDAGDSKEGKQEKTISQNTDDKESTQPLTRGKGQ